MNNHKLDVEFEILDVKIEILKENIKYNILKLETELDSINFF